jgi:predicted AAA+ superfamily ATPase
VFLFADDMSNTDIFKTPSDLIYYLDIHYDVNASKEKLYLFIDEFQYIKNAGLFLKNIFDKHRKKIQIIVSGSSRLEITKNTEFLI